VRLHSPEDFGFAGEVEYRLDPARRRPRKRTPALLAQSAAQSAEVAMRSRADVALPIHGPSVSTRVHRGVTQSAHHAQHPLVALRLPYLSHRI